MWELVTGVVTWLEIMLLIHAQIISDVHNGELVVVVYSEHMCNGFYGMKQVIETNLTRINVT